MQLIKTNLFFVAWTNVKSFFIHPLQCIYTIGILVVQKLEKYENYMLK